MAEASTLGELRSELDRQQRELLNMRGQASVVQTELDNARMALAKSEMDEAKLRKVLVLLRSVAGASRDHVVKTIVPLGQMALADVFGPDHRFEIEFNVTEKGTGMARILTGVGDALGSPLATDGASAAEVICDAVLRPLVVALQHPPLSRTIILDEPFAGVDPQNLPRLAWFLRTLCDELGMQFILTTHIMDNAFDEGATVIRLSPT